MVEERVANKKGYCDFLRISHLLMAQPFLVQAVKFLTNACPCSEETAILVAKGTSRTIIEQCALLQAPAESIEKKPGRFQTF